MSAVGKMEGVRPLLIRTWVSEDFLGVGKQSYNSSKHQDLVALPLLHRFTRQLQDLLTTSVAQE